MTANNLKDRESFILQDDSNGNYFIRNIIFHGVTGQITAVDDTEINGVTPYTIVGNPVPVTGGGGSFTEELNLIGYKDVSQQTVLGDYKAIKSQQNLLWSIDGTGVHSWNEGEHTLTVGVGQHMVMKSYRFHEYVSGNPQTNEFTTIDFAPETGLAKRAGVFHDTAFTAPYNTSYDGIMIRTEEETAYIDIYRWGVLMESIPFSSWDNQTPILWEGFNAWIIEYLWLGGTAVKLSQVVGDDKIVRHIHKHSGQGVTSTLFGSPNQPITYSIHSTTGSGTFKPVCARVSTGGSVGNVGFPGAYQMANICDADTPGVKYLVMAIRLRQGWEQEAIREISASVRTDGVNDNYGWELLLNPTIANEPAWTPIHADIPLEYIEGDTAQTISGGYPLNAETLRNRVNETSDTTIKAQRIIGVDNNGNSDIIAAVIQPNQSNLDARAAMSWVWR